MNVYLTLDYELFLGERTGTPENCLIKPMNELMAISSDFGARFTVFVDAAYLLKLYQLKGGAPVLDEQFNLIVSNIIDMQSRGHDIQLHFHPQWLYSQWDNLNNQWILDQVHYKLTDMPISEAYTNIISAKKLLENICDKKVFGFRAGGFCMDSFYKFKSLFISQNLLYDSSVARGLYIDSPIHSYDYRNVPSKQIYSFEDSVFEESEGGTFTEMSISSFSCSSFEFISKIRPLKKNYYPKIVFQDGKAISDGINLTFDRIKRLFSRNVFLASIDGPSSNLLDLYYKKSIDKGQKDLILIGHPKNASDVSITNLGLFFGRHKDELKYNTLTDLISKRG